MGSTVVMGRFGLAVLMIAVWVAATVLASPTPIKDEQSKRAFDNLGGIRGFGAFDKRSFDNLAIKGFSGFDKRSPTESDKPAFKRSFDALTSRGFSGAFDKRAATFDSFMSGPGFSGMDRKRSFDSLASRGFSGAFDKRGAFDSLASRGFSGFD
ncbi:hypothetical protein M3Y94_00547700 [Aphelenchoides besseyi]|nr:hypothetical protein M3Y94_00547700 [Aphelenchoides besseyi]KAI6225698.1 hypothetical protein M3Y95_00724600 [Aphelenchoides besseyi]